MHDEHHKNPPAEEPARSQTFDAEGPLELDVDVGIGRVDIRLGAGPAMVEVRQDSAAQHPWAEGATTLLNWVGDFFGGQFDSRPGDASVVQQTRIEKIDHRLVVQAPKMLPVHDTPIGVTVHAPSGSQLTVRSRLAPVTVTGPAQRVDITTGSGDVTVDQADGPATVRTGNGSVRLGRMTAGLQLRSGSGDVDVFGLSGSGTITTGSGDVWLGEVTGDVLVRTSRGDLSVGGAASGSVEAVTGSGDIRIGVRTGVTAELDLSSGNGEVFSELDVADTPPDTPVALTIRARSGSGDAAVIRAAG